jgi:hypothetical protein
MRPGAAADSEPSIILRASSPQPGTCPPRDPILLLQDSPQEQVRSPKRISVPTLPHCRRLPCLVILLASGRIHRRKGSAPPGDKACRRFKTPGVPTAQEAGLTTGAAGQCARTALPESPAGPRAGTPSGVGLRLAKIDPTRIGKTRDVSQTVNLANFGILNSL